MRARGVSIGDLGQVFAEPVPNLGTFVTARIIARSDRSLLDRDTRELARILLKVVEAHRKVTERRGVQHTDIGLPAGDHAADLVGSLIQRLPEVLRR